MSDKFRLPGATRAEEGSNLAALASSGTAFLGMMLLDSGITLNYTGVPQSDEGGVV